MSFTRREFLVAGAVAAAATMGTGVSAGKAFAAGPSVVLPGLPWKAGALAPVISEKTISFHYGKHHQAYVNNVNKMIAGTPLAGESLEGILKKICTDGTQAALFNNAAQAWNHAFFWKSLNPGKTAPNEAAQALIMTSFGSVEEFRTVFTRAAGSLFGSGWTWIVYEKTSGKMKIVNTENARTPFCNKDFVPLAVLDVWEHAYYLDYQNRRPDYIAAVFDKLLNWNFIAENLATI